MEFLFSPILGKCVSFRACVKFNLNVFSADGTTRMEIGLLTSDLVPACVRVNITFRRRRRESLNRFSEAVLGCHPGSYDGPNSPGLGYPFHRGEISEGHGH